MDNSDLPLRLTGEAKLGDMTRRCGPSSAPLISPQLAFTGAPLRSRAEIDALNIDEIPGRWPG